MTLYLLTYNNYYNRIIRKEDQITDYSQYVLQSFEGINFAPNDGIDTKHVLNFDPANNVTGREGQYPDYLIVTDDLGNLVSRWFIIDAVYTRLGQYEMTLHRDVITDHIESLMNAPAYIERAIVDDSSPLIFNSEGLSVNQIKKAEYLLKDGTQCAWICGYIPRDFLHEESGDEKKFSFYCSGVSDLEITNLDDWDYYTLYAGDGAIRYDGIEQPVMFNSYRIKPGASYKYYNCNIEMLGPYTRTDEGQQPDQSTTYSYLWDATSNLNDLKNYLASKMGLIYNNYLVYKSAFRPSNYRTSEQFDELLSQSGKIIHVTSTDKYYRIEISTNAITYDAPVTSGTPLYTAWNDAMLAFDRHVSGNGDYALRVSATKATISLIESDIGEYSTLIATPDKRQHLYDAPYDMFCIPYPIGFDKVHLKSNDIDQYNINFSANEAMSWAQGIAEAIGKDNVYDVQLLPYCPISTVQIDPQVTDGVLELNLGIDSGAINRYDFIYATTTTTADHIRGLLMWSTSSHGTIYIGQSITVGNTKMDNETDMWRLCSPNWNGQFQFSAAKNNGVDFFKVDYTYLPYRPYIRIAPNFRNLYGDEYSDARGLVCSGDFSISYLSDAWVNYQVQNKNYSAIFDRQIANMDYMHEWDKREGIFGAVAGSISGAAGGAMAGAIAGPIGAVAGGIIGGITSALGGAMDVIANEKKFEESRSYQTDMYNYGLGNVKALPDAIAGVTAFNNNNKVFPVLEYYTCTDTEKLILANNIAYNSMLVNSVGRISDYTGNTWSYSDIESKGFIKGKFIRLDEITEDFHMANVISKEFNQGFYLEV